MYVKLEAGFSVDSTRRSWHKLKGASKASLKRKYVVSSHEVEEFEIDNLWTKPYFCGLLQLYVDSLDLCHPEQFFKTIIFKMAFISVIT